MWTSVSPWVMVSMAAEGAESAAETIGFGFIYAGH
jgi:hypothetical protein